jgi:AhpD family alkylhydroperoxidase
MVLTERTDAPTLSQVTKTRIGATYTLRGLAAAIGRFVPLAPRAGLVWGLRRMEPALREQVMLTVARTNGCRYCRYIHQEWAIRSGVSDDEIAQLEGADPATFDRARWSALVYARVLVENDFADAPADVLEDVANYYSAGERRNIEAVAQVMTIVNRCANTMDALLSRLRGTPASESLPSELVVTASLLATGPIIVPVLSLILRKSPLRLLREFRAFTAGTPAGSSAEAA